MRAPRRGGAEASTTLGRRRGRVTQAAMRSAAQYARRFIRTSPLADKNTKESLALAAATHTKVIEQLRVRIESGEGTHEDFHQLNRQTSSLVKALAALGLGKTKAAKKL